MTNQSINQYIISKNIKVLQSYYQKVIWEIKRFEHTYKKTINLLDSDGHGNANNCALLTDETADPNVFQKTTSTVYFFYLLLLQVTQELKVAHLVQEHL